MKHPLFVFCLSVACVVLGFYLGNSFGIRAQLLRSSAAFSNQLQSLHSMVAQATGQTSPAAQATMAMLDDSNELSQNALFWQSLSPSLFWASFRSPETIAHSYRANSDYIAKSKMEAEQD